jgi:hypothetical protein
MVRKVKNLVSAATLAVLALTVGSVHAASLEAKAAAAQPVTGHNNRVGINTVIRNPEQSVDIGGGNIFAVLGGGLVAVSLLARRRSAS